MGVDSEFDNEKLTECRKVSMRRNVMQAFERARDYSRGINVLSSNGNCNLDEAPFVDDDHDAQNNHDTV